MFGSSGSGSKAVAGNGSASAVIEGWREPEPERVRLDPLDPKTSRHAGQYEFASETDAAVLKLALKVKDGMGGDYWWVECGGCDCSWAVPHYAEESVG
jgi:hypothetical protein